VIEINRGAMVLEKDGKRYLFGLPEGSLEVGNGRDRSLQDEVVPGKMTGENRWEVNLDGAIALLTQASQVMKEARIRPYFAIGKAAGIKVDRIKDESVIGKMGLHDGDVIKGVNGFELMSPKTIFEAYRKYKDRSIIELQLLRNDNPVTLTYNIIR
jgi:general secretion pathway protein C